MRLEFDLDKDENLDFDEISQLQADRDQLIKSLFTQYPSNEIAKEQHLIEQMMNADAKLKTKTVELKQVFASQLVKLKKGKKSTLTYQKY